MLPHPFERKSVCGSFFLPSPCLFPSRLSKSTHRDADTFICALMCVHAESQNTSPFALCWTWHPLKWPLLSNHCFYFCLFVCFECNILEQSAALFQHFFFLSTLSTFCVLQRRGGEVVSHKVMLSLSVEQQKQGPAEIACRSSTFLVSQRITVPGKNNKPGDLYIKRALFLPRSYGQRRSCTLRHADVQGDRKVRATKEEAREIKKKKDHDMKSRHLEEESNLCFVSTTFLFVFHPPPLPLCSISYGDLSFPAGPMLISYWSSGLTEGGSL